MREIAPRNVFPSYHCLLVRNLESVRACTRKKWQWKLSMITIKTITKIVTARFRGDSSNERTHRAVLPRCNDVSHITIRNSEHNLLLFKLGSRVAIKVWKKRKKLTEQRRKPCTELKPERTNRRLRVHSLNYTNLGPKSGMNNVEMLEVLLISESK